MAIWLREHYLPMMVLEDQLIEADWGHIQLCGLEHVHEWLDLRLHSPQLFAVIERCHMPIKSFHLPTREETVILLDVW